MNLPRLNWILATATLSLALPACVVETEQPVLEGRTVRFTVLHTSDIHSRLFPTHMQPNSHDQGDGLYLETGPYGGAERLAALIRRERNRGERVVHLDSGDIFHGGPIFNFAGGEPEFRWLSLMRVEAMAVGNHELGAGAEGLAGLAANFGSFPFLAANYIFANWLADGDPALGQQVQPYTMLNVKGLRVAVIGVGDDSSVQSISRGGNSFGITPVEANETVRAYVEFLGSSADLILVLSHLGLNEDRELVEGHELTMTADMDVRAFLDRPVDPWQQRKCEACRPGEHKYWVPGVRGIDAILGGHLHVLLRPPMMLTDLAGRKVLLQHPGAFAKFLARLDLAVAVPNHSYTCDTSQSPSVCMPQENHFSRGVVCQSDADCRRERLAPFGAEIIAHSQQIFPVDTIWCAEPRPDPYDYDYGKEYEFERDVAALAAYCGERGDGATRNLLEPYRMAMELSPEFLLTQVLGYAPRIVLRRDTANGGDSALGNIVATSLMIRKRVEAEFAVTNALGIRDNIYPGPVDIGTIFNVFPFENTIVVMYLSGREIQEMFDFLTERGQDRGCQSQVQIAGASFVMNCGQVKRNRARYACTTAEDCCPYRPEICAADYEGSARWQCLDEACFSHPAEDIQMGTKALLPDASYKLAANDYIAQGGSGFYVLQRNTTKIFTGIPLQDALIEHLRNFPNCREILSAADSASIDPRAMAYCSKIKQEDGKHLIEVRAGCSCGDVLDGNIARCGSTDTLLTQFCRNPLEFPVIIGQSDQRIGRKIN